MDYSGIKVLIMGLGLHGGGLESARFFLKRGALLTVTDLRDEKTLLPAIEQLDALCREYRQKPLRYVLGRHEIDDFKNAGIVIKNPGVRPDSPFLRAAKQVETDISIFLAASPARLFAVTGTKGKSCTAGALHWILNRNRALGKAWLGGNITISPLSFIDKLDKNDDVVLELSSFQLGDLKGRKTPDGNALLKPYAAVLTAIMKDHLDRYASMEEYIDDKKTIYRGQDSKCITVAGDDAWGKSFHFESKGIPLVYSKTCLNKGQSGGWLEGGRGFARLNNRSNSTDKAAELVPENILLQGGHQKINLLAAALAAYAGGVHAQNIRSALSDFKGIEHRLEFFHKANGVRFYNDSAATIPEAAAACIEALSANAPLIIVAGGADKNLDFTPLVKAFAKTKAVILLAGAGGEKLAFMSDEENTPYSGPFDNLENAVCAALEKSADGDIIALSPGCASFGMFLNEFDRGNKWKEAVLRFS